MDADKQTPSLELPPAKRHKPLSYTELGEMPKGEETLKDRKLLIA